MREIFPDGYINNTEAQKIALLKDLAKELVDDHVSIQEALPQLREIKDLIQSACRDPELKSYLSGAKSKRVTLDDLIKPGDKLNLKPQPFILNGVFLPNSTNLIIGREKKGKTAFVIAWIAAWFFGQEQFCDFDIIGPCPPVFLIGPDMSQEQWATMLHQYHLADEDGELLEDGPIKRLLAMDLGLQLDQHGLDFIDQLAEWACNEYPDQRPLFVFDSYARLVEPLGLQEATSEFSLPLSAAQALLRKRNITDIWLHHSAANRDTGKATSRGSTALPAVADQQVFMEYPTANEDDDRTMLRTKGREIPVRALIERTKPDGVWVVHASGDEVEEQNRIKERIDRLKDGTLPKQCFDAIKVLYPSNPLGIDLWQLADALEVQELDSLRKPMKRLVELRLVSPYSDMTKAPQGGRPRDKYKMLASVQKLLRLDFGVQKQLSALGNTEIKANSPETPDSNGSKSSLAYMENYKNVHKPLLLNALEVSGTSRRADDTPSPNGSSSAEKTQSKLPW